MQIYVGRQTASGVIIRWSVVADLEAELSRLCDDSYISESGECLIFGIVTKNYYGEVGFIYREFRVKHGGSWEGRYRTKVCPSLLPCYFEEGEWFLARFHEGGLKITTKKLKTH